MEQDKLQSLGVIKRVDEPTLNCAPIVVVPKKNKNIRLCVDLTHQNEAVLQEQYTLPAIDHMLVRIAGVKVFSKLDCNSGFHQIPLSPNSMLLITFTTPYGCFCYTHLSFCICSISEVFQKRMIDILGNLDGYVCLIDDVLVFGKNQAKHDAHLCAILLHLCQAHVTLNEKCEFSKTRIKFAGHSLSAAGIGPDPDRLSAVIIMAPPSNITKVCCFLGMVNQLAKFFHTIAELSAPVRDLLRKDRTWV